MKKLSMILATIVLFTGAFALLTGCQKEEKVLVMATEATFRPYEYMDGNDIVGVDVEIAEAIAEELGAKLEIDGMSFDAIIPAVQSGKADFGAAGMSITEKRLEEVDFSIEYATSTQVILTTADSGITGEEDLAGKVIGVQMSTTADLEYNTPDYPELTIESYKKYTDAVLELNNGRIDAIILDSIPAQALLAANENLIICEDELFTDAYAIAVKKGNTELLETINKVLTRLLEEGKIEEYTEQHLAN